MKFPVLEAVAGSTLRLTWVCSGQAPSAIHSTLYDRNDALVSSMTAVDSGGGLFYADHFLPSSKGQWYVNRWYARLNVNTYVSVQFLRALWPEVD